MEDGANSPEVYSGFTALHLAAIAGKQKMVQILADHCACVNSQTSLGDTPLFEACFEGHLSVVEDLLRHGADLEVANNEGVTCLMIATYADNADVIKVLVEKEIDLNRCDIHGRNALFYVVAQGMVDTLAYLLDSGAQVSRDCHDVTLLMEAASHARLEMVKFLLIYHEALGFLPDDVDQNSRNVLFYLVQQDQPGILEQLLAWGVPFQAAQDGRTLLMCAALRNNISLVTYLVKNADKLGLDLTEKDCKGRNCLFYCITGGCVDLLEYLVSEGVPVELSDEGATLLMQAVAKNRTDVVLHLLDNPDLYDVEVNARDKDGWNVLLYAVASGHGDLFALLCEQGAQCHPAADGRTVLMQAAAKGDTDLVRHLLDNAQEFGIYVNQRDMDGWNALFYTVQGKALEGGGGGG